MRVMWAAVILGPPQVTVCNLKMDLIMAQGPSCSPQVDAQMNLSV